MISVLIIAALIGIGVLIGLLVTAASPVGYQDQSGFHYGPAKEISEEKLGYPVAQAKAA
jgi:hypothetical protein